jgi:hypothetical protein
LTNKEKQVTIILLVWWSLAAGKPMVPSRWQATALSSSTAGQVAAAVKVVYRCMIFLIRRQLNQLDATG